MRFQANYISTSVAGDYYQAMFEAEGDSADPASPYLLIQRQFEMPDAGECYIETHDETYIGHFLLRRVEFTPEALLIELDRPSDNLIDPALIDQNVRRSIHRPKSSLSAPQDSRQ